MGRAMAMEHINWSPLTPEERLAVDLRLAELIGPNWPEALACDIESVCAQPYVGPMSDDIRIFNHPEVREARSRFYARFLDWREAAPDNNTSLTQGLTEEQRSLMSAAMDEERKYHEVYARVRGSLGD